MFCLGGKAISQNYTWTEVFNSVLSCVKWAHRMLNTPHKKRPNIEWKMLPRVTLFAFEDDLVTFTFVEPKLGALNTPAPSKVLYFWFEINIILHFFCFQVAVWYMFGHPVRNGCVCSLNPPWWQTQKLNESGHLTEEKKKRRSVEKMETNVKSHRTKSVLTFSGTRWKRWNRTSS